MVAAPGRTSKLTSEVEDLLVVRLAAGDPIESVATEASVTEQSVRNWLAWGKDSPDSIYGPLVRRIAEARRKLLRRPGKRPKTKAALNKWLGATFDITLPAKAVCPGHVAPLDIAWDIFDNRVEEALVLASRSGGKTLLLALIHAANGYWKPGHTTTHFGSVENQAKRAYQHFQRFIGVEGMTGQIADTRIKKTEWRNGSQVEILPGTEKQTQGPHTNLVTWDELESGERQPYENARGIPINDEDGHSGQFITTSTRQKPGGLMQQALDDAPARGARIYTFCVWETIEPCRIPRKCKHSDEEHRDDENKRAWKCTQPLAQYTEGLDLKKAAGWRPISDVLATYRRMAQDTFEVQVLNMRPEAGALIYANFTEANISEEAEYVPGRGVLWFYDSGFNDPTWIGFVQLRGGAFHLFDEISGSRQSARHWIREGVRKVVALPDYDGPSYDEWLEIWNAEPPRAWPKPWPQVFPHATGDPTAGQFHHELKEHGIGRSAPKRVKHEIVDGQDVLRAAISAAGVIRFFVHPRCEQFRKAAENFRANELPDGSYSERPDPTPGNHKFSHPVDGTRYGVYRYRRELGLGAVRAGRE